jgi:hypothetical protein
MKKFYIVIILLLIILIITVIIQPYYKQFESFDQEIDNIGYESEKFPQYNNGPTTSLQRPTLPSNLQSKPTPVNITSGSDRVQSYSTYQQQQQQQQQQQSSYNNGYYNPQPSIPDCSCDCAALQKTIDLDCGDIQSDLNICEQKLADADLFCTDQINIINTQSAATIVELQRQYSLVQGEALSLGNNLTTCTQNYNNLVTQNNTLITDNGNLRSQFLNLQNEVIDLNNQIQKCIAISASPASTS